MRRRRMGGRLVCEAVVRCRSSARAGCSPEGAGLERVAFVAARRVGDVHVE